jgi:hypothetical protein
VMLKLNALEVLELDCIYPEGELDHMLMTFFKPNDTINTTVISI